MRSLVLTGTVVATLSACTPLGSDFVKPEAPRLADWSNENPAISRATVEHQDWWTVFKDPDLDRLIETAYKQNLSLQIAGLRILEARARLGIAIGDRYPQVQQLSGSASKIRTSEHSPNFSPAADTEFSNYELGFDAAWELDFWGRFRRGIEAAEASLQVSVADYDAVLVTLTAEVARIYISIRTLQARLALAQENIELQQNSLQIAQIRFNNGATSELDVQQAKANLAATQARVPALSRALRQAHNSLSILLGKTPGELTLHTATRRDIPVAPAQIAVGVPADLLRRRPDVRQAEYQAASQSALIGVAQADLYPSFSLLGSIGLQSSNTGASDAGDLFGSDSLKYSVGPVFSWKILNYGRLRNNVRVQDARYQQALVNYRETVLRAYQETEDAMIAFHQSQLETAFRAQGAQAAQRASELANIQYREGAVDFQRVIDSERSLVEQQDLWISTQGDIALNLIAVYKALGGGWALRDSKALVADEYQKAMTKRTQWGQLFVPTDSEAEQ